jgi:hypothetical protein
MFQQETFLNLPDTDQPFPDRFQKLAVSLFEIWMAEEERYRSMLTLQQQIASMSGSGSFYSNPVLHDPFYFSKMSGLVGG